MAVGDWWSVSSTIYRHHFIEVFHGKVVHLFDEAKLQRLASVRVDDEFVATRGRKKRLHGSGGLAAAQLAMSRIGDSGYDLAYNNCEHFARWCTTGEHRSKQVTCGRRRSFHRDPRGSEHSCFWWDRGYSWAGVNGGIARFGCLGSGSFGTFGLQQMKSRRITDDTCDSI